MKTDFFGPLDYALMAIYASALVVLGLHFKKKASESLDDYLVGGRTVPWWVLGLAGMTNCFDLSGSALIISFLYMMGPRGLFIEFRGGVVLILIGMMLWTGKWHRRSGCLTGAEWNIFRFGDTREGKATELISVLAGVLISVGMLGLLILGAATFLSMYLPLPPLVCALILVGLATVYTMMSGFYGVVYTDVFQSVIILSVTLLISGIAFFKVSDHASLTALATRLTGSADWGSASLQWHTSMPPGYEMYRYLGLYTAFYLVRNLLGSLGTGTDPRYFGARTDRDCGLLTAWWTFLLAFRWPMMMGMAVLGLFAARDLFPDMSCLPQAAALIHRQFPTVAKEGWNSLMSSIAYHPQQHSAELIGSLKGVLGSADFASRVQMVSYEGTINPERILPSVLQFSLSKGLRGIVVIALLSGALTTFGGTVNSTAGLLVRNIFQRYIRPGATTRELILAGWASVICVVAAGCIFAATARSLNDIWGWITMGLGTGLMVPTILRLYWWRFNAGGFIWGTTSGLIAAVGQRVFLKEMTEVGIFIFAMGAGLAGSIIGTYVTRQTDAAVLRNFYLKTRPFGLWGALKHELPAHERETVSREHRNDLLAAPFALLWHVSMFLTPMLVVIKHWQAAGWCFALWLTGAAGLYWFWYRNLPATNWYGDSVEKLGAVDARDAPEASRKMLTQIQ